MKVIIVRETDTFSRTFGQVMRVTIYLPFRFVAEYRKGHSFAMRYRPYSWWGIYRPSFDLNKPAPWEK